MQVDYQRQIKDAYLQPFRLCPEAKSTKIMYQPRSVRMCGQKQFGTNYHAGIQVKFRSYQTKVQLIKMLGLLVSLCLAKSNIIITLAGLVGFLFYNTYSINMGLIFDHNLLSSLLQKHATSKCPSTIDGLSMRKVQSLHVTSHD